MSIINVNALRAGVNFLFLVSVPALLPAVTTTPGAVRSVEIVLTTRADHSGPGATDSTALSTRVRLRNR